jgi:hypothetical protein
VFPPIPKELFLQNQSRIIFATKPEQPAQVSTLKYGLIMQLGPNDLLFVVYVCSCSQELIIPQIEAYFLQIY